MATTDNRDVPKEQIFGPIVMDRGRLRVSRRMDDGGIRVWDCRHWCSWSQSPNLRPRAPRLCQMVPEGFYCDGGAAPSLCIAGSCSQCETQAKEGWRPSCLPHHLGPVSTCPVYLTLHAFSLVNSGTQYHTYDSTFQQAGNGGWRSCTYSAQDLPQTSLSKHNRRAR